MSAIETKYFTDASREYYISILDSYLPLYASDPKYLQKIRQTRYLEQIEEITTLPEKEREELIDAFTDLAIRPKDRTIEEYEKLKDSIAKIKKYGEKLERALHNFEKSLQPHQQLEIFKTAIIKINSNLRTIYKLMKEDLKEFIAKNGDIEFILLSKQTVYTCIRIATDIENRLEKNKRIDKNIANKVLILFILMIELEAVRRKKVGVKELYDDLTFANTQVEPFLIPPDQIGSLYDILNLGA